MKKIKKISDRITTFVYDEPFSAYIILKSIFTPNKAVGTIGIRLRKNTPMIQYNEDFINGIPVVEDKINNIEVSDKYFNAILTHEILHLLFLHVSSRHREPRELWMMAADFAINSFLPVLKDLKVNGKPVRGLFPEDFKFPEKLSAEEYFQLLEKDSNCPTCGKSLLSGKSDCGGSSPDGGGSGGESPSNGHSHKDKEENDCPTCSSSCFDDCSGWEEDSLGVSYVKHLFDSYKSTKYGTMPGELIEELKNLLSTGVSWKHHLRKFYTSLVHIFPKSTHKRFSRRYGAPVRGTRPNRKSNMMVALDVSGSMASEFLSKCAGDINHMINFCQADVYQCDTQITSKEIKTKKKSTFMLTGRGGTILSPLIEEAKKGSYDGLIIFTDGQCEKLENPGIPTIFVTPKGCKSPADFGEHIEVP